MKEEQMTSGKFEELRKRAQMVAEEQEESEPAFESTDSKRLIHELATFQIELELQNEDLRQSQEELHKSSKRISDLYDFAPAGYLTISAKGLIIEANITAADMLGVSRRNLIMQPLSNFIADENQDIYYHFRKTLLESRDQQLCELHMLKSDKSMFYAQLKSAVNTDLDGSSGQFRMILTDITVQKQLESTLLQSEEWEKTFNAMNDMVTLIDGNLRITRSNKAAHLFFGVKPGELNGKRCYELIRQASSPCAQCPIHKTAGDSAACSSDTIERTDLNKIFRVSCSPVYDKNSKIQYIVQVAQDVTEIKKLEENYIQSQKMEALGTLAGGIAHDFNNILTAIIGFSQLIVDGGCNLDMCQESARHILKAGNRAKELVKQILTFSRKNQPQQLQPMQPQIATKETLQMMRATLPATTKLEEAVASDCSMIKADKTQFSQIIVNLCTNAFQALKNEQGVITVKLSNRYLDKAELSGERDIAPGQYVELLVQDNGCGMSKATLKRIFEPYFTTKKVGEGSGIGLALVHGIVSSHGGTIRVISKKGEGSTFAVYFPALGEDALRAAAKETGVIESQGNGTILVVDDEEAITLYLKKYLERLGYTVIAHSSSIEALRDFKSRPEEISMVITDQTMPEMTGVELIQQLLQVRPEIPVILCTGYSSAVSESTAEQLGVKRFFMKPIDGKALAKSIKEILDKEVQAAT